MTVAAPPAASRRRPLPPWPADRPLRKWQTAALGVLDGHEGEAFLASATPAAGKTTFGLHVAHRMLSAGAVGRVVVVAPTTHICRQWAADAARYGIDLEPNRPNSEGPEPRDRHGITVTYQTIAAGPAVHRKRALAVPTLLIADEPHHMGEQAAWGTTAVQAFGPARLKLLLSGTPFRSDNTAIPWVRYDDDGVSSADYTYSYTQALHDRVCRPVTFCTYDGDMEWMSDGRRRHADFSVVLPAAEAARRLRTALDPDGDWIAQVLRDADRRLSELRAGEHPDAGALVIAADKEHADRLASRLERLTGARPPVVTSDDPNASRRIAAFSASREPWLVSVLMVSEGVDIPRLRVGVYATPARTELFFRQVIGRFIRRTPGAGEQMSWVFLPSDGKLKALAATVEEERRHALQPEELGELGEEPPEAKERGEREDAGFHALSSTGRLDDLVMTSQPGDQLGLFGGPPEPPKAPVPFARPEPVMQTTTPSRPVEETSYEKRERLRDERQQLVAQLSRATGEPYRAIHARVNKASGAASVSAATVAQLEKGNARLVREIARRG
jgi:superfamily II DNA or RNA helicase